MRIYFLRTLLIFYYLKNLLLKKHFIDFPQRLGAQSEDSNTNISMPSPSPELEENKSETQQKDEPKPNDSYKDNGKDISEKNANNEESLTPPLLPNMKMKDKENQKENNDNNDVKTKTNDWDMFADQDIFKDNTNVSIIYVHFRAQFKLITI